MTSSSTPIPTKSKVPHHVPSPSETSTEKKSQLQNAAAIQRQYLQQMGHLDNKGDAVRPSARPMTAAAATHQQRPMTGFTSTSTSNKTENRGFIFGGIDKFLTNLDDRMSGKKPRARPQTAGGAAYREKFLEDKMKVLEEIEKKIDEDMYEFK